MSKAPTRSRGSRPKVAEPRSTKDLTHADRAERYAKEVVAGKILACREVKLACRRHLDDLKDSRSAAFPWRFDAALTNRFCEFWEAFPHVKDDFLGHAGRRETFRLEDWQCFTFGVPFGWVDRSTGVRRYRELYVEVPRKNGKTPAAAVIGNYCLTADGEYGAEVFAGASTKNQAQEVFQAARSMALAAEDFRKAFGVWVNAGSLVVVDKNASFKMLKGSPADGPSPHCVLADEYHEYKTNRLIEWALTGMTARRQPLLVEITTAGTNTASPCYEKHLEGEEVLEGRRRNDRLWVVIYTVDLKPYEFNGKKYPAVDWKSEKALRMSNPNYGVSVNPEAVRHGQEQARQSATQQASFKTKNENIWLNAAQPWMNMERWDACADPALCIEDFAAEPCIEAVDLASRKDTVSTARLFKRQLPTGNGGALEDHVYCFTRHYLNAEQVRDEKHPHFADWADKGYLIETEGNVTDYLKVNEDLAEDANGLLLRELVYDPYHAAPLVQYLRARSDWPHTVEIVDLKQNEENVSPAMKEFEALVLGGRFHHDGNPALAWMVGNTRCKISQRDNWYPVRENAERKIDGTVAIILGMNRLMQVELESWTPGVVSWI